MYPATTATTTGTSPAADATDATDAVICTVHLNFLPMFGRPGCECLGVLAVATRLTGWEGCVS